MNSRVLLKSLYISPVERLKGVEILMSDLAEDSPFEYGYTYLEKDASGKWQPVVRWESSSEGQQSRVIGYCLKDGHLSVRQVSVSLPRSWSDVVQMVKVFGGNLKDMEVSGL